MCDSEFKSFSFMGVSNPEMFLSEKDLNALELNFLPRPTLEFGEEEDHECQITPLQEDDVFVKQEDRQIVEQVHQVQEKEKEEEEDKCRTLVSSLKIKLPNSLGEFKVEEEDQEEGNDGFKTPTSLDFKIPPVLQCPPAPRKPKSRPLIITKRKLPAAAAQQRRILQDLSNEIEAMFPPVLLADLGKKIKKVRQEKK